MIDPLRFFVPARGPPVRGYLNAYQQTDRRNAENLAEAVDGATSRALQRFLTAAPWAFEPAILANAASLIAVHCHPSGSRDRFVPR